jgi:hypothetical protein
MLSDAIEGWDVGGIYLIAEHPSSEYLVDHAREFVGVAPVLRLAGPECVSC